jgi:hypothetical protein
MNKFNSLLVAVLFVLPLIFISCDDELLDPLLVEELQNPTPVLPPVTNEIAFFRGSIDGTNVNFTQSNFINPVYIQQFYHGGCFLSSFDCVIDYGAFLVPYASSNFYPSLGLSFMNLYNQPTIGNEVSVFNSLFSPIPTNFISESQDDNDERGIEVSFTDSNNVTYSTLNGNQQESIMTVLSSVSGTDVGGYKTQTITGTVNCKLYSFDNPQDVKTLSNGTFKLIFRQKTD